ncbi:putative dynamin-related protein 4A [Platanthera zijinensis]|uniref:Dynamin-related protein 4A n=1 Tax=Platanthera zijinensis TaxID=2320716 RepID=A0AAP0BY51_9ASPA
MQKRMDKLKWEVELLKKWNASLIAETHEDPPLNPYGKRLQKENILEEGFELLTIVVVSNQTFGKASVIESLAGINLPQGGTEWSSEMSVQHGLYL